MLNSFLHDISWVLPFRNDILTPIFEAFTWLGYPTFITFFLPFLYWLWNKDAATRLFILVMLSTLLNAFLKDLWVNPRPDIVIQLDPEVAQSYGMPSGHAQVSGVLWLWLAFEIKRLWAGIGAIFIVTMICLSRIYLGVHDVEDILAGLAIAALSMAAYRMILPSLHRFCSLNAAWHIFSILSLMILLSLIWPGVSGGVQNAQSYETLLICALMMGWIYGRQWDRRYVHARLNNSLFHRKYAAYIITALVGIISLLMVNIALRASLSFMEELSANFILLLIMGFYMTFGAPLLFKTLRLSH